MGRGGIRGTRLSRRGVGPLATIVLTATAFTAAAPPAAMAQNNDAPASYVALGDSYASGPLIVPQEAVPSCFRSGNNYPHLVARELGITEFDDVTCNGASSTDLTDPQHTKFGGNVPAQYDALDKDTELVTVTIGGNDVGLFDLALSCLDLPLAPRPTTSCVPTTGTGPDRFDQAIDRMGPTYNHVAHEIHIRSPKADVVFVGYPTAIRDGGCPTIQPMAPSSATYLQARLDHLNAVMAEHALASGATYVDTRTPSVGHDVCAPGPTRWLEGVVPESDSEPLHPNLRGHQNMATQVISALDLSSG